MHEQLVSTACTVQVLHFNNSVTDCALPRQAGVIQGNLSLQQSNRKNALSEELWAARAFAKQTPGSQKESFSVNPGLSQGKFSTAKV